MRAQASLAVSLVAAVVLADVAIPRPRRGVFGDTERKADAVAQHVPPTTRPDVSRAEVQEPAYLARQVVGAVIEMGSHRTVWLIESLEEQLERGTRVIVPLAGELART